MNLSAKTEYATIAVLELAGSFGAGEPVRIRDIAEAHGIPPRFLVQILLQLKGAGLVASTRGAAGGYQLIRDPADVTLADVVAAIEGPPADPHSNTPRPTPTSRVLLAAWREAAQQQQELLSSITFADLVAQARGQREGMYYI